MEKESKFEKFETREIMKIPEIEIKEEPNAHLLSLVLKGYDREWGNQNHPLVKETDKFFENHPLNPEVDNFLKGIKALQKDGIDEETLYNLSLTYQHPERKEEVFEMLKKHKDIQNPEYISNGVDKILGNMASNIDLDLLEKKFTEPIKEDIEKRTDQLPQIKDTIKRTIDFFRPNPQLTKVEKITITPTDFLYKEKSGKCFNFGKEVVIMIPPDESTDSVSHEFLHTIINPITEKLAQKLTEEEKKKITQMASGKLRDDYGEEYYSLLNETLIRTYVNSFSKGEGPDNYEKFQETLSKKVKTEEQFQKAMEENFSLPDRFKELGIENRNDLIEKQAEYFEAFEKNELGERAYNLYQKYSETIKSDQNLNFEDYLQQNYKELLKITE